MADLVTKTEVKTYLSITDTKHDTLIDELIDIVSALIEDYCNTYFSSMDIIEYIDGGYTELVTKKAPIISITKITDSEDSSTVSSDDYDFYPTGGRVYQVLNNSLYPESAELTWGRGKRRWKVEYKAGRTTAPEPVKMACYVWIQEYLKVIPSSSNSKGRFTQPSYGTEVETEKVILGAMPLQTKSLLARYKVTEV